MSTIKASINREQRDVLSECIRQLLEQQLSAENFPLKLFANSDDRTVDLVVNDYLVDLDEQHYICQEMTKLDWDLLQRLLLVLESDRHIVNHTKVRWTRWQLVAVFATGLFVCCALIFGLTNSLMLLAAPFGLISYFISRARRPKPEPYTHIVYPFESFRSLSNTYDEVGIFRKMRIPNQSRNHQFSPLFRAITPASSFLFWIIIFPSVIVLPFQILPNFDFETSVA